MLKNEIKNSAENQLHWLFTFISMLIACQVTYIQHGWINDDSVLYFEVSRLFALGQWKDGLTLYNWPLYPALVAGLHKTTQLSIQQSAQVLNVLFFALTTHSFISIIRLAGGNKSTIISGAFLLFSTTYIVGDVLPMLLRDQGFWAFFLLSITFFIHFYRQPILKTAFLWQVAAMVAILFRVEAITFLVLLPVILLLNKKQPRFLPWIYANSLSVLALFGILITILTNPLIHFSDFGRLQETLLVIKSSYVNITHVLVQKADLMGTQVLGHYFDSYGMIGLVMTLMLILISKCVLAPGWFASLLLVMRWRKTTELLMPDVKIILYWIIGLAILNASVILISTFILSGRYLIALGFMMLVLAAFALTNLLAHAKTRGQKAVALLLIVLLSLGFISNLLPKNARYNYEQDAVNWVKKHSPANAKVFYVSPRMRFYADEPYTSRGYEYWNYTLKAIEDGSIMQYEYLLINMNSHASGKESELIEKLPNYNFVKEFNSTGDKKKVMIFVKK